MRARTLWLALLLALVLVAGVALGQYSASNYREQGGARWVIGGELAITTGGELDGTEGGAVRIPNGSAPPATCSVGAIFLDTDETVDTNCTTTADNALCYCVAANTWAANEP